MSVQDNTHPNIPYLMARGIMSVLGGLVGFFVAVVLLRRDVLIGPNNLLYLTVPGCPCRLPVQRAGGSPVGNRCGHGSVRSLAGVQPQVVLAAGTGATVALLITVLLNNVLAAVPGFTWFWSLLIASVLVVSSSWFFVVNRNPVYARGNPAGRCAYGQSGAETAPGGRYLGNYRRAHSGCHREPLRRWHDARAAHGPG